MLLCLWAFLGILPIFVSKSCNWERKSGEDVAKSPEIFWINMDKSVERRRSIEAHLNQIGWLHRRVKGLSLDDMYIPTDVRSVWDHYEAQIDTTEKLLPRSHPEFYTKYGNASHFLVGLVGRGKKNRLKEVGCTSSHLEAMRQAIYNNRSSSKYAVITEDDIFIPFNIDFQKLAESAPPDFGILQLFNSNEESMESVWKMYRRSPQQQTWKEVFPTQAAAFWSTCAYLINREIMKPVIDSIAYQVSNSAIHLKIVAGIKKPCRPKLTWCCKHVTGTYSYEFQHTPPCFWAPRGLQADSFIYALNKTYVLTVPLITNGAGGNQSTFHQDHVENIHQAAFRRQRQYINELINGHVPIPSFVTKACTAPLPLQMELVKNFTCNYSSPKHRMSSIPWYYFSSTEEMGEYVRNVIGREGQSRKIYTESELFIPPDMKSNWDTRHCLYQSLDATIENKQAILTLLENGFKATFAGLCGRGNGKTANNMKDLAMTVTHLQAISQAMKSTLTNSQFVIVSDDKVILPFDLDWEALVASAPTDFGILAFMLNDDQYTERLYSSYVFDNSTTNLWSQVHEKYYDFVSTQFYVVNLAVIGPKLRSIVMNEYNSQDGKSILVLRLIAATTGANVNKASCQPKECCLEDTKASKTAHACVSAPSGHRPASYLWKLAEEKIYVFHLPVVLRGKYGQTGIVASNSKNKVSDAKQRQIVNSMVVKHQEGKLPAFFKGAACPTVKF